jgi:hypothetical protein
MTPEAFKKKIGSYWKLELLRGALFTILLGSSTFPTLFVAKRSERVGFDSLCVTVISVSYGIIAALMFCLLARFGQKTRRNLQGHCPECGRFLLGKASRRVLETNRCPGCGTQVLG